MFLIPIAFDPRLVSNVFVQKAKNGLWKHYQTFDIQTMVAFTESYGEWDYAIVADVNDLKYQPEEEMFPLKSGFETYENMDEFYQYHFKGEY